MIRGEVLIHSVGVTGIDLRARMTQPACEQLRQRFPTMAPHVRLRTLLA